MFEVLSALRLFLDPALVGLLAGGVGLGLFVGAVPGLTATLAIALLLPFTYHLPVVEALVGLVLALMDDAVDDLGRGPLDGA